MSLDDIEHVDEREDALDRVEPIGMVEHALADHARDVRVIEVPQAGSDVVGVGEIAVARHEQ